MKRKRLFVTVAVFFLCGLLFLSSCAEKTPGTEQETTENLTTESSQEESKPASKYTTKDNLIALTFDDGPSAKSTNRILDVLEKNNSTATFFVVGYNIEKNISTIKRAHSMGCEIGNHSQSHKNLMKCSNSEIRNQVDTPNKLLKELADIDVRVFRAPGGNFDGVEEKIGMPLIQWNVDTLDWKYKDASNEDRTDKQREADLKKIADEVVNNAARGDIVLMHDIYGFTADLCEIIVPALTEKGFKLVTVSEMYDAYGEELKGGKVYRNIDVIADAEPLVPGNYRVKTNGGVLNIREKADKSSQSLARIPNRTDVTVLKSVKGWAYVEYSGVHGWVNAAFLEKI